MSGRRVSVPRALGALAAQVASGQRPVAEPRDAATVALVREADGDGPGVEVLLLRRVRAMDFAPGAHVFPGGSVDPGDAGADLGAVSAQDLGSVLGVTPDRCRALVGAAVRETFEESRVRLHAALLTPWARWITPEASDRRYDTWFFVAAMPADQVADAGIGTGGDAEADAATWLRPAAALDAARAGEITLLPPTAVTLQQLAAHDSVAEILTQRRTITPLMPSVQVEDGRAWLTLPDGVEYPL